MIGPRKMLSLSNFSVKAKLSILCFTFIAGMMVFGIVSYTAIESLRIGGERYQVLSQLRALDDEIEMPVVTSIPTTLLDVPDAAGRQSR
jgi:hypothetical protein